MPSQGLPALLKEGTKHITGLEEAVARNIDACRQLSAIVRTSLGPNGMNKMIVNHLGKLMVTSDAATIVRELEVIHPAAKLVVMASESQEREVGDGTGFVVTFAGELLDHAEKLLRMGLNTAEIVQGMCRIFFFTIVFFFRNQAFPLSLLYSRCRPACGLQNICILSDG